MLHNSGQAMQWAPKLSIYPFLIQFLCLHEKRILRGDIDYDVQFLPSMVMLFYLRQIGLDNLDACQEPGLQVRLELEGGSCEGLNGGAIGMVGEK